MALLQWFCCNDFVVPVSLQLLCCHGFVAIVFAFPVRLCLQAKLPSFLTTGYTGHLQGHLSQLKFSVSRTNFFIMTSRQYYLITIHFLMSKPTKRTQDIHRVDSNRRKHSEFHLAFCRLSESNSLLALEYNLYYFTIICLHHKPSQSIYSLAKKSSYPLISTHLVLKIVS